MSLQKTSTSWAVKATAIAAGVIALSPVAIAGVQKFDQYQENHHISQGEIIQKIYDDPDTWVTTQCNRIGQTTQCSPITHHDGEHYRLEIRGENKLGEIDTTKVEVDRPTFKDAEVGQEYDIDNSRLL